MNKRERISDIIFYIVCAIFSGFSIFSFFDSAEVEITDLLTLLFFGGLGIMYYILKRKENKNIDKETTLIIIENRSKILALAFSCLVFVICSFFILPFHHLFDDIDRYSFALGYIAGSVGMLFFGFAFIVCVIKLIKPKLFMKISDEGILFQNGFKGQMFIHWKDVQKVKTNGMFFSIYLKNPSIYPVNKFINYLNLNTTGTNLNFPTSFLNYNIDQVERFINKKLTK